MRSAPSKSLLGSGCLLLTIVGLGGGAMLGAGCASTGQAPDDVGSTTDMLGRDFLIAQKPDLTEIADPDLGSSGGPDLATSGADLRGATSADLAAQPDLTTATDLANKGLLPGEGCNADNDCASGKCQVLFQGAKFCVVPCTSQADCAGYSNLFCEATTVGSSNGYCIPRSPAHCSSCTNDGDCGSLSERCFQAPSDIATACHVDCAIAGADACPADYTCTSLVDNGVTRKLCLPNTKICLDSLGGFCDRVAVPQTCARANSAGQCTGQRVCLQPAQRFDKCNAAAPQYKTCTQQDPAGCMLLVDPTVLNTKQNCGACGNVCGASQDCCGGTCTNLNTTSNCGACGTTCAGGQGCCSGACTALNTIQNCGTCGNACPGQTSTSDALCASGKCDMTCRGDNYDVDKSAGNGCEVLDAVPPAHTQASATSLGNVDCYDSSGSSFSAGVPSDGRVHANPAISGFSGTVGAAPDWWSIAADGGTFCQNNYSVTITTKGGGTTVCYQTTIITNKMTQSMSVNGKGTNTMTSGASSYSGGTTVYIKVEKTCSLPVQENVSYTIDWNL